MVFLLLIVGFEVVEHFLDRNVESAGENAFSSAGNDGKQLLWNGQTYTPKASLETILILGIDSISGADETRVDSKQADFLALLILDKNEESFHILHLNRDTMTEISQVDVYGRTYGSYTAQLTLAHTYGVSDRIRCRNTVSAVENLLYGIQIDHFLSLTMDAVAILNDSVGGVTVRLMDDFTYLEEAFVKDAVVTLKGSQALAYVRARGGLEDSSNLHRMERQKQYIQALIEKYSTLNADNTLDTLLDVNAYMTSDCTVDQLSRLLQKLQMYENKGILSLAGEAVQGKEYVEYYIDDAAAQEMVVELFYKIAE